MKILVYVHMWPPIHNAGSEVTVNVAMTEMARRGHDVVVIADRTPQDYEHEGVKVLSIPRNTVASDWVRETAKDADILITHLDLTSQAMQLALDIKKPLVHFVHNHAQLGYWRVNTLKCQLAVFNSRWIAENEKREGPQIVLHPIIEPEKYRCKPGTKITFCNPTQGKGVETVHKLAETMPDYEFLIVEGIYGEQVAPPHLNEEWEVAHPNIEHMKNDPDFRNVLRKTKVLLMPSGYESYGRCAAEAACAGIPSIVHPTQGLWEALEAGEYPATKTTYGVQGTQVTALEELPEALFYGGLVSGAGIFCLRDDIPSWQKQIERLYKDEVYYRSRSDAALKLANSFDPESDFDRLEDALVMTTENWNKKDEGKTVKMWTPDVVIWETSDGKLVRSINGRIPQNAIRSRGLEPIPEEVAIANGLIPGTESKAVEAPEENKAISAPEETKAVKTKKTRRKVA